MDMGAESHIAGSRGGAVLIAAYKLEALGWACSCIMYFLAVASVLKGKAWDDRQS